MSQYALERIDEHSGTILKLFPHQSKNGVYDPLFVQCQIKKGISLLCMAAQGYTLDNASCADVVSLLWGLYGISIIKGHSFQSGDFVVLDTHKGIFRFLERYAQDNNAIMCPNGYRVQIPKQVFFLPGGITCDEIYFYVDELDDTILVIKPVVAVPFLRTINSCLRCTPDWLLKMVKSRMELVLPFDFIERVLADLRLSPTMSFLADYEFDLSISSNKIKKAQAALIRELIIIISNDNTTIALSEPLVAAMLHDMALRGRKVILASRFGSWKDECIAMIKKKGIRGLMQMQAWVDEHREMRKGLTQQEVYMLSELNRIVVYALQECRRRGYDNIACRIGDEVVAAPPDIIGLIKGAGLEGNGII